MQKLTAQQLREHLKENNNVLRFENKIEMVAENVRERGVAGEVSVTLPVEAGREDKVLIDLVAQYKTIEAFIEEAYLNSIEDLENIKRSFCWSQYLKGSGFVNCTVTELDGASICFKVQHGITVVYSKDLHYYDELGAGLDPEHASLTLPEHFIDYIEERMERLGTFAAIVF